MDDVDLSPLGLSGSATTVLAQLMRAGERSVSQLAVETGIAPSVVSRAVRDLAGRRLVEHNEGRPRRVALSPGLADAVTEMAADLREGAEVRATALETLGAELATLAPAYDRSRPLYWLVPLRADATRLEDEVRTVGSRFRACVPAGRRPRGVPRRRYPSRRVTWQVLMEDDRAAGMWVPASVDVEVRRHNGSLPWLELLDDGLAATEVLVQGCRRTAWCAEPGQVALAAAAFERWWDQATPAEEGEATQSTSVAQPLDRATAARQRR